jgi:hypothetical protein
MADFTLSRGDTIKLNVAVTASGSVYSLVGSSMWFTAKYSYSDPDSSAVFQKTIGSGITLTDAVNGKATVLILPTDTSGLANAKVMLVYDLQVKDASGNIYTVARGNLIFLPDVTLST